MKKLIRFLIVTIVILGAVILYMHRGFGGESRYVTSQECRSCHERHYDGWKLTLHPKMFRPAGDPGEIVGDFDILPAELSFKKEDVEYIVGNKWEQVYAKMVDGEYYQLPAKWYITTKRWVPIKKHDKVKMSLKCNGCHTTGFNPETFEFAEFGIGCEACHGPGSRHISSRKKTSGEVCAWCHGKGGGEEMDIITSVSSTVCGQCHNRGTNKDQAEEAAGKFNFPLGFIPGDDLDKSFAPMKKESDKKGKYWWGNGISKNRHQEYMDWQKSKHSKALKLMQEEYSEERGKKDDRCLRCHSADYRFAPPDDKPTLETARYGVTCVSCHDPHGFDRLVPRHTALSGYGTEKCGGCHIDSMTFKTAEKERPHYPCPPTKVSCADCHMPYIVTSGGAFSIRSHAFKIINPADTVKFGTPNTCQNGSCHQDRTVEWAAREFKKSYPLFKEVSLLEEGPFGEDPVP